MTPSEPSADRRDADLRLVHRLRVGLVSAGVLGSLGVAGVVAASAGERVSADPSRPVDPVPQQGQAQVQGAPQDDDSFSEWNDDGGDGQQPTDPWGQQQPPPSLQQGFGSSHGSTGGS